MAAVRSTIVCPACGHRGSEIIPEDACQYFYQCKGCRVVLKPRRGAQELKLSSGSMAGKILQAAGCLVDEAL